MQDASSASVCSDEGFDVSQRFNEAVFSSPVLDNDADDVFTGTSRLVVLTPYVVCKQQY
jgi:hypothetical protein